MHGELPVRWAAIEVLEEGRYSTESDIWAYGVLVYEVMSSGVVPYADKKNLMEVAEFVKAGGILLCPPGCPDQVYNALMMPCFQGSASDRPSFVELKETALELGGQEGASSSVDNQISQAKTAARTSSVESKGAEYFKTVEGRKYLGVSVHHLGATVYAGVTKAVQSGQVDGVKDPAKATIWHAVQAFAKPQGASKKCPRDGNPGTACRSHFFGGDGVLVRVPS